MILVHISSVLFGWTFFEPVSKERQYYLLLLVSEPAADGGCLSKLFSLHLHSIFLLECKISHSLKQKKSIGWFALWHIQNFVLTQKSPLFSHMHTVWWCFGAATKLHQQTLFPNLYLISAFELSFDIPASNSFITKHIHTQPSDNRKFLFSFVSSFLERTSTHLEYNSDHTDAR